MDIEIKTDKKYNKKRIIMRPIAPEFEGEEYFLTITKAYAKTFIILGAYKGVIGKDLEYYYVCEPYPAETLYFPEAPIGFEIVLKIKDKEIRKKY